MDIFNLVQRLRHPDPRIRVETLRILAMVEETRALAVIGWVYQNDPESGVREVANWAGQLIFAAKQRGYSTQRAIEGMFSPQHSSNTQELFLQTLERDLEEAGSTGHRATQRYAAEQAYHRRLSEALRPVDEPDDDTPPQLEDGQRRALPATPPAATTRRKTVENEQDLLDAGLSDLFAE
jgi:hypothetical protein